MTDNNKAKQVRLLQTCKHPKGAIEKGAVYNWNEQTGLYEFMKNGIVISTINEPGVNHFNDLFERL